MEGISKNYSSNRLIKLIYSKKSYYWEQIKKVRALKLFHEAAKRVPAYKDFLKKQNINHENIHTFNDFQNIPPVSKKNYLTQYPQKLLNWGGSISKPLVFTSTSGSTGESFYFPRQEELDWQYSILIEKFLNYGTGQGPALVIICFGMGIWIGGLITYKAFEIASRRGQYPVSIITPGINKKEIFRVLKRLAPQYNQIILVGYPPFLKDIIDEAAAEKINMKKLNIRLLFAAEPFTEKFRNYIAKTAGIKNHCLDTLNIYGTADIGAMAWETPASILIRRVATNRKKLFNELFSSASKTPTLAQYNPFFITFEAPNGEILLTGNNAIPLIRYAVGDHGGVLSFNHAISILKKHKIDFKKQINKNEIKQTVHQLPFVFVYERSDFSVILSGANIYPEEIKEVFHEKPLADKLTSKFTMMVKNDKNYNEYLEINIELKPRVKKSANFEKLTQKMIMKNLIEKNSEYAAIYQGSPERNKPKIIFWPYEHELHFKPGIKQKWVKK